MTETIRVNFSRPIALFPLPTTLLLPHAVLPLHMFEARYRRMISDCVDGSGQFAMASWECGADTREQPIPLREAVCLAQIIQHHQFPDGRYNVLVHGICRARINHILEPTNDRPYRMASIVPHDNGYEILPGSDADEALRVLRRRMRQMIGGRRMRQLHWAPDMISRIDHGGVPTPALVDMIGAMLMHTDDAKYGILAERDVVNRARSVATELGAVDHLLHRAELINRTDWPKWLSWN